MAKLVCPNCKEELDSIENRDTLLTWDEKSQKYVFPYPLQEPSPYCPQCGRSLTGIPEVANALEGAIHA